MEIVGSDARKKQVDTEIAKLVAGGKSPHKFDDTQRYLWGGINENPRRYYLSNAVPPGLARDICEYIERLFTNSLRNLPVIVAVVLDFLATGYKVEGVTVFPRMEWAATRVPTLHQLGGLAGIRCRAMTTVTRQIKEKLVDKYGVLNRDTVWVWRHTDKDFI